MNITETNKFQSELQAARKELNDFYIANDDESSTLNYGETARHNEEAREQLHKRSRFAYKIDEMVVRTVQELFRADRFGYQGIDQPMAVYYRNNRKQLANSLLDVLEASIK